MIRQHLSALNSAPALTVLVALSIYLPMAQLMTAAVRPSHPCLPQQNNTNPSGRGRSCVFICAFSHHRQAPLAPFFQRRELLQAKVTSFDHGPFKVVVVVGKLSSAGGGADALRQELEEIIDEGEYKKIIVDVHRVSEVDESGIYALVSAYTYVTNRGGQIRLAAIPAALMETFTALINVLGMYGSTPEAMDSFY